LLDHESVFSVVDITTVRGIRFVQVRVAQNIAAIAFGAGNDEAVLATGNFRSLFPGLHQNLAWQDEKFEDRDA